MATGPKIVHKQFNSPIGLYSQRNIQDTLNKHLQNLDNGTVGIDFSDPTTNKPGNLANSAVLRLLEEEEHGRRRPELMRQMMNRSTLLLGSDVPEGRHDAAWPC